MESLSPSINNGYRIFRKLSANDTTGIVVKAGQSNLYAWHLSNANAGLPRFVKFYDSASAPVVASDTPKFSIMVPASTTGAAVTFSCVHGIQFINGIGITITGLIADTDNSAPAVNEVVANLFFM